MDTNLELRIYNNYRAALAAENRAWKENHAWKNDHAAQRRNAARKITVERYKVSFAEVKRIVNEQDALKGITHKHNERYVHTLELFHANEAYKANPVPCPWCGNTDDVEVRFNPFDVEIYNTFNLITSCEECYERVAEDI